MPARALRIASRVLSIHNMLRTMAGPERFERDRFNRESSHGPRAMEHRQRLQRAKIEKALYQ